MKTITLQPNQSALDAVLMACGTMEGAMHIMAANDRSISQAASTGTVITIPDDVVIDKTTLQYYEQHGVVLGTGG